MSNPKIVYTPAGGTEQTLNFVFPPRQQPGYAKTAVRHDNVSTAGIRESVLERIDDFLEFTIEWIRTAEVGVWQYFLNHALTGATFAYYPDAAESSFTLYLLEDTEAKLEYKSAGMYKLALRFRKQVA